MHAMQGRIGASARASQQDYAWRRTMDDLETLERLAYVIKDSSLCGLGQTSSNPVLTTLRYFRDEYERHIIDKRCKAGVCENLFVALCENSCPLHMNIPGYLQLLKEGRSRKRSS